MRAIAPRPVEHRMMKWVFRIIPTSNPGYITPGQFPGNRSSMAMASFDWIGLLGQKVWTNETDPTIRICPTRLVKVRRYSPRAMARGAIENVTKATISEPVFC
jgi:hypothetical protein